MSQQDERLEDELLCVMDEAWKLGETHPVYAGLVRFLESLRQARAGHPAPHDLLRQWRDRADDIADDCNQMDLKDGRALGIKIVAEQLRASIDTQLGSCSSHSATAKEVGAASNGGNAEPSSLSVADQRFYHGILAALTVVDAYGAETLGQSVVNTVDKTKLFALADAYDKKVLKSLGVKP